MSSAESAANAAHRARTRASIQFLDQAKGTLPEAISERDLETLNAGLRFFFTDLRAAFELFQGREGHDRASAIKALGAVWRFIALFAQPLAENLQVPILLLQDALVALNGNHVAPMLRPVSHRGRAKAADDWAALKGRVAGAVMYLMHADVPQHQACSQVARSQKFWRCTECAPSVAAGGSPQRRFGIGAMRSQPTQGDMGWRRQSSIACLPRRSASASPTCCRVRNSALSPSCRLPPSFARSFPQSKTHLNPRLAAAKGREDRNPLKPPI